MNIKEINILLEMLRHYFRLGYDLGIKYKHFTERLNEIGRMCGGWLKSLK